MITPPPRRHNPLDPRRHPWRFAGAVAGFMVLVFAMLMAWIGLTLLVNQGRDQGHFVPADVVFNYLLVSVLTFVGLPLFHYAFLRQGWLQQMRLKAGLQVDPAETLAASMLDGEPLPKTRKPWRQRVLYVGLYVYGIAALMTIFGPLGNQLVLIRFFARFSAGGSSFWMLVQLVFMAVAGLMLWLILFVLDREGDGSGRALDSAESLRLRLKQQWLYAFVAALTCAAFLCFFIGLMTALHLS